MLSLEDRVQRIEDEAAIRNLVSRFADGETRNNQEEIRELWLPDGVFKMNEPMSGMYSGVDAIMKFLSGLRSSKDFFVQFIHSGIVEIEGDRATARWLVREAAKGGVKYYQTFGTFSDILEKRGGQWFFRERSYHFIFLDQSKFPGDAFPLPVDL